MISPRYPRPIVAAPAKAAVIEPMNAKDEPRKTGLFLRVNRR